MMRLFGMRGTGSGIAESMLALAGEPYEFVDVAGFDEPGAAHDRLAEVNPLIQVPALVFEDGTVLTETAAIALWLVGLHSQLAPGPESDNHRIFLRLLVWLVANVYPTFTYGDYPDRWVSARPEELVTTTDLHRQRLYLWLETQVVGPFVLGERVSVLDCYLPSLVKWAPRSEWFAVHTPKLMRAAALTKAEPALATVVAVNGL